jgi:3',5'-cyclic AMP phosphodiesterase CpdA
MRFYFSQFFKKSGLAAVCLAGLALTTCEYGMDEFLERANSVNARSAYIKEVDNPTLNNGSTTTTGSYTVLVLTDIHFGAHSDHPDLPEAKFWKWLDDQSEKPKFCLVLGDTAESGKEEQFKEFEKFAERLKNYSQNNTNYSIPVYSVIGNHDLYNNGWEQYVKYCEPKSSYYYFKTGNSSTGGFSWYALDSASGTLGGNQINDFIKQLKKDPNSPKIVFTHYPIFSGGGDFYFSLSDPHERAKLLDAYARYNVKLALEGHDHKGSSHDFGKFKEYTAAAFRDEGSWHIITVNEDNKTAAFQTIR